MVETGHDAIPVPIPVIGGHRGVLFASEPVLNKSPCTGSC